MTYEGTKTKIEYIYSKKDEIFHAAFEDGLILDETIKKWCDTILDVGPKLIRNTLWDKKESDALKEFEDIYKNSLSPRLDLYELVTSFNKFSNKIKNRFYQDKK